ncbi:MAG TPA: sulfotransferase [Rhizomicrobium sp.]
MTGSPNAAPVRRDQASNAAPEAQFGQILASLRARRQLRHPRLREARRVLDSNRPDLAEPILAGFLKNHVDDVDAMSLLAEAATRRDRKPDAEKLLARCVELAPDFDAARFDYGHALHQMNKPAAALEQAEKLLAKEPRNPIYRDLEAIALSAMGDHARALACRRALAEDYPGSAKVLVSYAQTLRALGRQNDCIAAYRQAIAASPATGTAWWGLGNLRTWRFAQSDIVALQTQLGRPDLSATDRVYLLFALGKAYSDVERYGDSFDAYARANAIRRLGAAYDPATASAQVAKCRDLFTADFFRDRAGSGSNAPDPIFIVGMQRSGTTLLEQILASHPSIEGAGELPNLRFLARRLEDGIGPKYGVDYPAVLARLAATAFQSLAEEYLEGSLRRRPLGRPFFVDKDPFNFWHVGFIQLMLPNARIIDMRRHPLGCCFSNFTSIFLHGGAHTQRLSDLGRFYADYVALMAHYDRVLPGRVHRIFYEDLIADPESEIRRMLGWLDLPFEDACLTFHKNERAVTSASSEQVRSPIYREALDHWRHYEPWIDPLKAALGPVLTAYPHVPDFAAA